MAEQNGTFPELVIDIGSSTQRPASAVPSPLAQRVESTLREVLAWRPRTGESKSFLAALNQAFTIREVEGHTEWEWTPRSYAIQADMGAVTGAQASIYARAKAALDQSRPLIEGLYPLRSDADKEDAEAIRALVLSQLEELVGELGKVGGPRAPRVDGLFDALLGENFEPDDSPDEVEGLLDLMSDRFGFDEDQVNTIDEEQDLTNFFIVKDHVIGLFRSWDTLRRFFDNEGSDVFLGTQLVLLSRTLDVVAESVQEANLLMDSVFLGAGERQTVRLDSGLTIEELLSWVERFSSQEAKQIIRNAGKDGVVALRPTLVDLHRLVLAARDESKSPSDNPQLGFHHPRVTAALIELEQHLDDAVELATQLRRNALRVTRVFPASVVPPPPSSGVAIVQTTKDFQLIVDGNGFELGATVILTDEHNNLVPSVKPAVVQVFSESRLSVTVTVTSDATPGTLTLFVINPDSSKSDPPGTLIVQPRPSGETDNIPSIREVVPSQGARGRQIPEVNIFGDNLLPDMIANFGSGIHVEETTFINKQQLQLTLRIDRDAEPGPRGVFLVSRTGPMAFAEGVFQVVDPRDLSSVEEQFTLDPTSMLLGGSDSVTITSRGDTTFDADTQVLFSPSQDMTVEQPTLNSAKELSVGITIADGAQPGKRDVILVFGEQSPIVLRDAFEVIEGFKLSPSSQAADDTSHPVTITSGEAMFDSETRVLFGPSKDITVGLPTLNSAKELSVDITIADGAQLGKRDVILIFGEQSPIVLSDKFEVTDATLGAGATPAARTPAVSTAVRAAPPRGPLTVSRAQLVNSGSSVKKSTKFAISPHRFAAEQSVSLSEGVDTVKLVLDRAPIAGVDPASFITIERTDTAAPSPDVPVKVSLEGTTIVVHYTGSKGGFPVGDYRITVLKSKLRPAAGDEMTADTIVTFSVK
jgi:hypothetical protein